jgi:hypothetical protein
MRKLSKGKIMKCFLARWIPVILLAAFMAGIFSPCSVRAGQSSKEAEVETLIGQAESAYQKGNYSLAGDYYLQASRLAQTKINLSRAYFGLAISDFYLRDIPGSKNWIHKVLEVDPKREISNLFYPESFVQLFGQVRAEMSGEKALAGLDRPQTETALAESKAPEARPQIAKNEPPLLQPQEPRPISISGGESSGKWEVSVHVSSWGVNLVKSIFEDSVNKELGKGIRKEVTSQLEHSHAKLTKSTYEETLAFDSSGANYGLEARYYPSGRSGFFSLGFSLEKTHIRLQVAGPVRQNFTNGTYATVDSQAYLETSPFTANVNFRWDFAPSHRFCPYFVLGFGVGSLSGNVGYTYTGTYNFSGYQESVTGSKVETFAEAEKVEDITFNIPDLILILQLDFGLKAEIYKGLTILAEAGIWDGLILRGGLAYRF